MKSLIAIFFLIFLSIGTPIAFILCLTSLSYLIIKGQFSYMVIPQRLMTGSDIYSMLALPFFLIAGGLMNKAGATARLIEFSNSIIGFVRGGLAMVNITVSMFFSGISGSASADAAAIGSVLIPAMEKEGYDKDFSAAVTATASTMGPIIPPSILFIIYGVIAEVSIASLFLSGIIPGVLLGVSQMIIAYYISRRRNYPKGKIYPVYYMIKSFIKALPSLILPVIILGGILLGVFTPTESAVIAILYAFILGFFVYKELRFRDIIDVVSDCIVTTGSVMFIIASASIFGWVLTAELIPQKIASLLFSITNNPYIILLLINIFLLWVGTFLEPIAGLIILTPVFLPLVTQIGIDPVHFGLIIVLNLTIGLTTPPVGGCLFIACGIAKISLEKISRAIWPFIIGSVIVLLLSTYIVPVAMFIPNFFTK